MFVGVGVIVELNEFICACKKQFPTFEEDLNVYIKWHQENEEEGTDPLIGMIENSIYRYFLPICKDITMFEWIPSEKKEDDRKYIMFGIIVLICDNECMKATDFNNVTSRTDLLRTICQQFGFSDNTQLFVGDN